MKSNDKLRFICTYVKEVENNLLSKKSSFLLFTSLFISCSVFSQDRVRVATAANLANATKEVAQIFTQQTGIEVDVISSASGKLTAQILNGAPYHIFISADMIYPQKVWEGRKAKSTPVEMVQGQLVFWSREERHESEIFQQLSSPNKKGKIAIANPKLAPYGASTKILLSKKNLWNLLTPHFVYGENIGQVNRLIYAGAVEGAFTAASAMFAEELKHIGFWYLLKECEGIPHGVVQLSYAEKNLTAETEQFYKFLFSTKAKEFFKKFGYSVKETTTDKSLTE